MFKILNKYLPLKKITAYSDYKMPEYKKKEMLNRLEKLVNKKKRELFWMLNALHYLCIRKGKNLHKERDIIFG